MSTLATALTIVTAIIAVSVFDPSGAIAAPMGDLGATGAASAAWLPDRPESELSPALPMQRWLAETPSTQVEAAATGASSAGAILRH